MRYGVQSELRDPSSARFAEPFSSTVNAVGVVSVCGYVNGRNGYGGYTGTLPFVGKFVGTKFVPTALSGPDIIERQIVRKLCREVGIELTAL